MTNPNKTNKLSLPILLCSGLFFISFRCNNYCHKDVKFILPVSIYPDKEIFHIGDTIWIEMNLPYQLIDQISNEEIYVGSYPFKVSMNILEILDTNSVDGFHAFHIVKSIGELDTNGISFPRIDPVFADFKDEDFQKWKFGIIPTKKAQSFLLIFSKVNYYGDWSGFKHFPNDECDYAIDKSVYLTNDGNLDYESYLERFPQTHNPGVSSDTIANLTNAGAFFFSVE